MSIPPHLPVDELDRRYRRAKDPVARSQWQIVWLLARGDPTAAVAASTGYSATWIREVARRYREEGPGGIGDRRHANPGAPPLLDATQQEELRAALGGPAPDGGLWSGRGVAAWIAAAIGRPVDPARGGSGGAASASPRSAPAPARPAPTPKRRRGSKRGARRGPRRRSGGPSAGRGRAVGGGRAPAGAVPGHPPRLGTERPPPTARVERHDEWVYVYGFVRPATGQSWGCLLPTVNAAAMGLALATFARDEGIDATHRAVLVVDRAGWHVAHDLVIPDGIDLVFLPSSSPELQPAERR